MYTLTPEMQATRATFTRGILRMAAEDNVELVDEDGGAPDRLLDALFNEVYRPELEAMQERQERAAFAREQAQKWARQDDLLASSALGRQVLPDHQRERQADADAAVTDAYFSMQGAAYDRWHDQQRVQADAARKVQQQQRQGHDKPKPSRIEALLRSSHLGREALKMRRQ